MTVHSIEVGPEIMREKGREIQFALEGAVRRFAMNAVGDAKDMAPVITGRLRGSIAKKTEYTKGGITARIGSNVEYAPYVEYGTGDKGSNAYGGHVDEEVSFTAGWPGTNPHPYLRPAIYDKETEFVEECKLAVRSVLE